jgi:hypothetical protein
VTGPKHLHRDSDNVSISKDRHGNSKAYTVSRLKREAPELYEEVKAGKRSANFAILCERHGSAILPAVSLGESPRCITYA